MCEHSFVDPDDLYRHLAEDGAHSKKQLLFVGFYYFMFNESKFTRVALELYADCLPNEGPYAGRLFAPEKNF